MSRIGHKKRNTLNGACAHVRQRTLMATKSNTTLTNQQGTSRVFPWKKRRLDRIARCKHNYSGHGKAYHKTVLVFNCEEVGDFCSK